MQMTRRTLLGAVPGGSWHPHGRPRAVCREGGHREGLWGILWPSHVSGGALVSTGTDTADEFQPICGPECLQTLPPWRAVLRLVLRIHSVRKGIIKDD